MARSSTTRRGNGAGAPGYGGPAKGAGSDKPKTDFGPDTNAQGHSRMTPAPLNRRALWEEEAAEFMGVLAGIARDASRGPTQVKAIETFQDRVWGKAVAHKDINVKLNPAEMTDEQLAAVAAGGLAEEE